MGGPPDPTPLTLDGAHGEGGGQIVRTALALAVTLGRAVTLTGIRARRPKPGLQPQHLTVVRALAAIGDAEVTGDALGSTALGFAPRAIRAGDYRFDVGAERGSAGAVSLLCQALVLPLALARAPSRLTLIGGTHVPWSPPVHYLTEVFFPALRLIGIEATLDLRRWGWYPAGGGEIHVTLTPSRALTGFVCEAPAADPLISGISAVSRLPRSIAERQKTRAEERLAAAGITAEIALVEDRTALGPGTLVFLSLRGRAGFSALGRRGLPAERVADQAADELLAHLASGAAVDAHLADQLVPFLALAASPSSFTCPTLSPHLQTVAWTVRQFLPAGIELGEGRPARVAIAPGKEP
ncbi:MAG: RNA 3'-phosphate cyclase [Candidatus Rokubacteria bacterium]|nr:RNA 3'-phosphate cyclase [Candidatus Rokubacteria bacterium]